MEINDQELKLLSDILCQILHTQDDLPEIFEELLTSLLDNEDLQRKFKGYELYEITQPDKEYDTSPPFGSTQSELDYINKLIDEDKLKQIKGGNNK